MRPPLTARNATSVQIAGRPTGSAAWRRVVAEHARGLQVGEVVGMDFVLTPNRWVDLDTLVESTVAGLRDAGVLAPRLVGLDGIVATKRFGDGTGTRIRSLPGTAAIADPPGSVELDVHSDVVPRAERDAKRAWRDLLAAQWCGRVPLTGAVWADVAFAGRGSLLGPLEVVLDALEPVLGRDPRGRAWQEFFPNDDRIDWLRVSRQPGGPAVRLQLGQRAS